jgi:hypothetical protein
MPTDKSGRFCVMDMPTYLMAGNKHTAGNKGQNLHVSEILSNLVEPVVETFVGGLKIISQEEMLNIFDNYNKRMEGWTPQSWWEGFEEDGMIVCTKCEVGQDDSEEFAYDDDYPERCKCGQDGSDEISENPEIINVEHPQQCGTDGQEVSKENPEILLNHTYNIAQ